MKENIQEVNNGTESWSKEDWEQFEALNNESERLIKKKILINKLKEGTDEKDRR